MKCELHRNYLKKDMFSLDACSIINIRAVFIKMSADLNG